MNLEALKSFPYAGKQLAVGEVFKASDKDARLLKALKKAKDEEVKAEPSEQADASKRAYKRKDMRAE